MWMALHMLWQHLPVDSGEAFRYNREELKLSDTEVPAMKKLWILLLAVLMVCAGAAAENEDLSLGMTGPKVLELNTRLRQLNYTATPAVEVYSDATKNAVMAVQKNIGVSCHFLLQGSNLHLLHWQADSLPLGKETILGIT